FTPKVKAKLRESGYTPLTAMNVMRLMAHLSRWLDANALGVAGLTGEQVDRYVAERRAASHTSALSPRSLAPILTVLAGARAVSPAGVGVRGASGQGALRAGFERHLLCERALTASTAAAYVMRARRFLASLAGDGLAGLSAGDVTRAVLAEAEMVSAGSAQYFVAALRAVLRFCFAASPGWADLAWAA